MRVLAACILALSVVAAPAMAGTGGGPNNNNDPAARGGGTTPATPASSATPAAPSADPAGKPAPASPAVESELQQLRELLESQARQSQLENQELRDQLREQRERMALLEEELRAAKGAPENPEAGPKLAESAAGIGPSVAIANAAADSAGGQEKPAPPTSINIKGISLTPVGFMAAETVWRQKALAADVNTPLNANPFSGSSNAHMGEFQASGRQSRVGMLVEGKLDTVKIGGYYEFDFLSSGTTSNPNQSNSFTARQRQFWAQAALNNGWTFTGGQQWSLLTETTQGMNNRSEALPQVIDAQYVAGFSWARQYGFRVTKNFNNKFWLGFSVEQSQATLTVHNNATAACAAANPTVVPTTPATCSSSGLNGTRVFAPTAGGLVTTTTVGNSTVNNFLLGQFGAGGGLNNPLANYQYNPSPDFVIKAAFEPGFGHYEVFGVFSQFRDRVFPCVGGGAAAPAGCTNAANAGATPFSAFGAYNDSRTGGGGGANARWNLLSKHIDFGLHGFVGDGIGRYGSVGLPDATVRPNGTLALLRNYQSLGTIQLHPTPKLDINLYVGGEYTSRASYIKATGVPSSQTGNEGYGARARANYGCTTEILPFAAQSTSASTGVPTGVAGGNGFIPGALQNCDGDTRNVIEGSVQFWYRFYRGSHGTLQYGMQYSNWIRNTWAGVGTGTGADGITHTTNGTPHSDNNMVFTSFRYVLP